MTSIGGISANIQSLLSSLTPNNLESLGLTKGEKEILLQLMTLLHGIVADGIEPHEISRLIGLLNKLGDILGDEFLAEIEKIIKKLEKMLDELETQNNDPDRNILTELGPNMKKTGHPIQALNPTNKEAQDDPLFAKHQPSSLRSNILEQPTKIPENILAGQRDIAEDIAKLLLDRYLEKVIQMLNKKMRSLSEKHGIAAKTTENEGGIRNKKSTSKSRNQDNQNSQQNKENIGPLQNPQGDPLDNALKSTEDTLNKMLGNMERRLF